MGRKHHRAVNLVGVIFGRGEAVQTAAGASVLHHHVGLAFELGEGVLNGLEVQDLALRIVLPEPEGMARQTGKGIAARQQIFITGRVARVMDEAGEIEIAQQAAVPVLRDADEPGSAVGQNAAMLAEWGFVLCRDRGCKAGRKR